MTDDDERPTNASDMEAAAHDSEAPPAREYHTDRITVQWHAERCIHSGNCVHALPRVFNPRRRPWVDIDAADAETIERAVLRCPSGALRFVRHDGGPATPPADGSRAIDRPGAA